MSNTSRSAIKKIKLRQSETEFPDPQVKDRWRSRFSLESLFDRHFYFGAARDRYSRFGLPDRE